MLYRNEVRRLLPRLRSLQGNARRGRSGFAPDLDVQSPEKTRQELLTIHQLTKLGNAREHLHERAKRQGISKIRRIIITSLLYSIFNFSTFEIF